ncbi:uncharacterized protein [Rutidosis leptorrhynchoides]|uniref:uncharacterized protein n=1 Tax=Rutidosis leptorrhynchoides TaxID=125765 RepID=UPI003A994639
MEVVEHEHPLCLIDMQPDYPQYEEEYDDETDDLIRKQVFQHKCDRCNKEINWFHRYYYKCANSCDYLIHNSCAELPLTLTHTSHSEHNLILFQLNYNFFYWSCGICEGGTHEGDTVCYQCHECELRVGVHCAMSWVKDRTIYHPSHQHLLVATLDEHECKCDACGEEHSGIFYMCTTCVNYFIHTECALMPELLSIQQATKNNYSHYHLLTLSYSFPREYQEAEFDPPCRVCDRRFRDVKLWIYKCEKCRYYAHLACTRPGPKFTSYFSYYDTSRKKQKKINNFNHTGLLRLPFPDETCNLLKHYFSKESGNESRETTEAALQYSVHQHPLILVTTSSTSNLILCHNPMKKLQLLCNGCLRPITSMPFYKCANYEDQNCTFVLHEWCTQLPDKLQEYPGHPEHTLTLYSNAPSKFLSVFICGVCNLPCNGFVYSCVQCDYHIDVNCGFIPEQVEHEAHPNHILVRGMAHPLECVYEYVNIKFGTIHKIQDHPHDLSLVQGIDSDGTLSRTNHINHLKFILNNSIFFRTLLHQAFEQHYVLEVVILTHLLGLCFISKGEGGNMLKEEQFKGLKC